MRASSFLTTSTGSGRDWPGPSCACSSCLVIDTNARVLNKEGKSIPGLYACGNCSTALLPTYPGPGSTLGPAMTFGYLAAKDITGSNF